MNDLPTPVGREVVALADDELVDLAVEVAHRNHLASRLDGRCEPEDKRLVRLRGDPRDHASKPTMASMAARQRGTNGETFPSRVSDRRAHGARRGQVAERSCLPRQSVGRPSPRARLPEVGVRRGSSEDRTARSALHELRHTAASVAIASGADVKVVQQMLGHASAAMTLDQYGHLFGDRLDDVADRMAAARQSAVARVLPEVDDNGPSVLSLVAKTPKNRASNVVPPAGFEPAPPPPEVGQDGSEDR